MHRRPSILLTLLLALSILVGTSRAQEDDDERRFIDIKQVPAEGSSAQDFVPRGWKIAEQVTGDLNGDSKADIVLKLIEDLPESDSGGGLNNRFLALLVLFNTETGKLHRAAVADRLLRCTGCAGMLGDGAGGNASVTIEKGVIVVNQLSGSREATDHTQRFRYDARLKSFVLIGEDVNNYDRAVGGSVVTSINYLTGVKVVKKYRFNKKRDDQVLASTKTTRVPANKRFIEDIDYEKLEDFEAPNEP